MNNPLQVTSPVAAHLDQNPAEVDNADVPFSRRRTIAPDRKRGHITLALDLGTHTGWVLMAGSDVLESGTILLASEQELVQQRRLGRERSLDLRFSRLLDFIREKVAGGVTRIVFEDVQFLGSQCQTQLWASLRTAIWAAVQGTSVQIACVSVPTLKFFAARDGKADKLAMAQALAAVDPARFQLVPTTGQLRLGTREMDDNEVDAFWVARYALAVDNGEREFRSVQQRRVLEQQERRAQRRAAKMARKARRETQRAQERSEAKVLKAAIKAMGRCCGVYRNAAPRGRAVCPKCGLFVRIRPSTAGPLESS